MRKIHKIFIGLGCLGVTTIPLGIATSCSSNPTPQPQPQPQPLNLEFVGVPTFMSLATVDNYQCLPFTIGSASNPIYIKNGTEKFDIKSKLDSGDYYLQFDFDASVEDLDFEPSYLTISWIGSSNSDFIINGSQHTFSQAGEALVFCSGILSMSIIDSRDQSVIYTQAEISINFYRYSI